MIKVKMLVLLTVLVTSHFVHAQLTVVDQNVVSLFNKYRFSQAKNLPWPGNYWPFDGQGKGAGINQIPSGAQKSPAQKYDEFFGLSGRAAKWEEENHNCEKVASDLKASCKAWYGHCNGWTGAALMFPEPDYNKVITAISPVTKKAMSFDYTDIKALLTESWLDAYVTFEGTGTTETPGDWISDSESFVSKAPARNNPNLTNYEAYWDVTPKTFFYVLTNFIGIKKVGIAIDRHTGSEIWNQPVTAYRFLPLKDSKPISKNGKTIHQLDFAVKLYWANDSVEYTFQRTASLNWSIDNPQFSNDKAPGNKYALEGPDVVVDKAYSSRILYFSLFFSQPVKVSADGKTVVESNGQMVGNGFWAHQNNESYYAYGLKDSQTHPDFLWVPDAIAPQAQYRNPHIDPYKFYKYILQQPLK